MIDYELKAADGADHLYRLRVRSEGKLGNKITNYAYCRFMTEGTNLCFCTIQP